MYPADVFMKLQALVRSGLLDLRAIQIQTFHLANLPAAMDSAENAGGLSCTILLLCRSDFIRVHSRLAFS